MSSRNTADSTLRNLKAAVIIKVESNPFKHGSTAPRAAQRTADVDACRIYPRIPQFRDKLCAQNFHDMYVCVALKVVLLRPDILW